MRRAHQITSADMAGHVTGLVEATEGRQVQAGIAKATEGRQVKAGIVEAPEGRQVQAGIVSEPVKETYV